MVPVGSERWVLTGIDPSATELVVTSLSSPPPAGAAEQTNQGPAVTVDGEQPGTKFVGPVFPERDFIFAVFALCERQSGRDTNRAHGLRNDAIAIGWFLGQPPWPPPAQP